MQAEDIITYKDIEDMISRENVRITVYALLGFAFTFIFPILVLHLCDYYLPAGLFFGILNIAEIFKCADKFKSARSNIIYLQELQVQAICKEAEE